MLYRLLADAVLIFHLCFVLFVVLGGLAVLRWPRLAWLHVPVAAWGSLIEFTGWICPLTPLENALRTRGGGSGYEGSFIDHYVTALIYPVSLPRGMQVLLGASVLALNLGIYAYLVARRRRQAPDR
jgi:hypothetical protein